MLGYSFDSGSFFSAELLVSLFFLLALTVWAIFHLITSPTAFNFSPIHLRNRLKAPKPSNIHLPQKIYFEQTADNNYGVGTFALDIITIGGHGRLKEARFNYEKHYIVYAKHFNNTIDLQACINNSLNEVGAMTYNILLELEKSRKLLSQPAQGSMKNTIAPQFNKISSKTYQLRDIADEKSHTGTALIQGTTVGGLAAVGSWTLVSMFGSASTGTAIASLSGIAAHNSILAWFGGGALAAGGGGMAAGTVTLGAIVALPIVLFSSYKTHSSANDLNIKTDKIKGAIPELIRSGNDLVEANRVIHQQLDILKIQHKKISEVNKHVYNLIYPNGLVSKAKRNINKLFKEDFYTKQEAEGIDRLLSAIYDVNDLFDNNARGSSPLIASKK